MDENGLFLSAMNGENYEKWRSVHEKSFGEIFSGAFSDSSEAALQLTAALIMISKRRFSDATVLLDTLEKLADTDFDKHAVNYFKGLNYEILGDEEKMNEYYERLSSFKATPTPGFYPYYRTAKLSQKDAECRKAVYYYMKALSLCNYEGASAADRIFQRICLYDIATVCLYSHNYLKAGEFIAAAKELSVSEDSSLNYISAVLYAVLGKERDARRELSLVDRMVRGSAERIVDKIFAKTDMHYCTVSVDRSSYPLFWSDFLRRESELLSLVASGRVSEAEEKISELLKSLFSPSIETIHSCRIVNEGEKVRVYCKNRCVKTLIEEHSALFKEKPRELLAWQFISVPEYFEYV